MELEDLRTFCAAAEERHFGRAAERLHMTQPALSRRIRRLEDELSALLVRRTTRRIEITDAGSAFLAEARAVLAAAERAAQVAGSVARGETGRIAIGAVTPAIDGFLPAVVRAFRERHPSIEVALAEMDTAAQLDALRADRIHVAFVRLFGHDVRGLDARVVHRERHLVALPPGHPLAKRASVPLARLAGEPFVMLAPGVQPELHRLIVDACAAAGFEPRSAQTARTIHTMTALVAAGMGVALVPESAAATARAGVTFRKVAGKLPRVEISAVWRRWNPSPALAAFRAVLEGRARASAGAASGGGVGGGDAAYRRTNSRSEMRRSQ